MKNSNNLKGLLGCQICQSRHGHRKLLPKGLEGPEGLLHFSEIPMSVDHSGRLENAPKHALPNGNVAGVYQKATRLNLLNYGGRDIPVRKRSYCGLDVVKMPRITKDGIIFVPEWYFLSRTLKHFLELQGSIDQ